MKALWLENQRLLLRDLPTPKVPTGEALVEVRLSGICGTDMELESGYYSYTGIIGHEFVGIVREAPDESWIGVRVVGEINVPCGTCEQCTNNRPRHCQKRTVLGILNRNGAHAEFLTLPLENLHRIPETVPDEVAVFCEPLAAALEILQQVHVKPSDRVLLIGAGRLGQLIAQTLALTACSLQVIAKYPQQEKLLTARGIELIDEDKIQSGHWDLVVEATGSPQGFELAHKALRPCGILVLKSTYKGEIGVDWSKIVVDELTIVGSRCGPFAPALRLMESRKVDPTPLITARYPLARALEAFQEAKQAGKLKILLER